LAFKAFDDSILLHSSFNVSSTIEKDGEVLSGVDSSMVFVREEGGLEGKDE
jgi:hypothetical protein